MAYYSAIKRKETLPFATTWMSVESIMLNEKRLKDEYCIKSLICDLCQLRETAT